MKKFAPLLGLAIGDALGQPFEFCSADKIKKSGWNGEMQDGDVWNLNAGQYTDDTLMALAIVESLLEQKDFVAEKVAQKYMAWVESGDLRGIGMTCERAIYKMAQGVPLSETGNKSSGRAKPSFKRVDGVVKTETDFCGNGTVMRIAPMASFFKDDLKALVTAAKADASMTHNHPDARDANVALVSYLHYLMNGLDPVVAFSGLLSIEYEYSHVLDLLLKIADNWDKDLSIQDVVDVFGDDGCAHRTIASALWCFLRTSSFKEAVCYAVKLGGDTDTRAAIVGAMAGVYYGQEGIPEEYLKQVEDSEKLQELDRKLYEARNESQTNKS